MVSISGEGTRGYRRALLVPSSVLEPHHTLTDLGGALELDHIVRVLEQCRL